MKQKNHSHLRVRSGAISLILILGIAAPILAHAQGRITVQPHGNVRVQAKDAHPQSKVQQPHTNAAPKLNLQLAPLGRDIHAQSSYAPVAKKVEPSVVTVSSTKTVKDTHNLLSNNPMFKHFFGPGFEDDDNEDSSSTPRNRQEQSLGSGVIVTADGYILSNSHVVDGADEVKVSLPDGQTEYTAKIIGLDTPTDISVLKIEATNLPAIAITDSSTLQVGDTVLAVGNPFGVGQTVTMGIVSAMSRGGFGISDYEDFIQTDASINPGNSGGALVDVEGRLVGIPTAILSRTGGNVGIGFAVPVNMARTVMDLIVSQGKVVRGYLGVYVQPLSPSLKKAFKVTDTNGALISEVAPNSPAAKSGLQEGDIVTSMNGKEVSDSRHLRLMIAQATPNTKVEFTVWRNGQKKNTAAMLGELPSEEKVASAQAHEKLPPTGRTINGQLGMQVRNLDATMRQVLKIPSTVQGVLVEGVERSSPAYTTGIRPGDVLQEVNRKEVHNPQEAVTLSKSNEGLVLLKVWSKEGSRFVVVDVGSKGE